MGDKPITVRFGAVGFDEGELLTEPDPVYESGRAEYAREEVNYLKERITNLQHYRELRKLYGGLVYGFMAVWSALVFAVIVAQGFGIGEFHLEVTTITTLIGGTTVSVIGLVGFILRGLFPSTGKEKETSEQ